MGFPDCRGAIWLPDCVIDASVSDQTCIRVSLNMYLGCTIGQFTQVCGWLIVSSVFPLTQCMNRSHEFGGNITIRKEKLFKIINSYLMFDYARKKYD